MFSSAKAKTTFIDFGPYAVLVARVGSGGSRSVVEDVRECPPGDGAALAEALHALQPKRSPRGLIHATCAIHTDRRVVRRLSLDLKRLGAEPAYLDEVAAQQLHIDPNQFTLALLNPASGAEYDVARATQRDAVVCGLPVEEINATQDRLLAAGLYPERLELGTVATVGALVDYQRLSQTKNATLMLEIEASATQAYILTANGFEASRSIAQGIDLMVPVVQAELGLKDAGSARKLFLSNSFDFTSMGPALVRGLLKELQSFIGFYEVQTGLSIGQVVCTVLPSKLGWIEESIAGQLGVAALKPDFAGWLQSRHITLADALPADAAADSRRLGLLGLIAQYTNNNHAASA